jgi:peptidoglycan/xylan/chitin deacetylase (PgdA/CDA1 family)
LLITFDDGWADTAEYAQPILDKFGFSALIFVAGEALNQVAAFWEERLYSYLTTNTDAAAHLGSAFALRGIHLDLPVLRRMDERAAKQIIRQLGNYERSVVETVTNMMTVSDQSSPAMLSTEKLANLLAGSHTIGAHGLTHRRLSEIPDLEDELRRAKEKISGHLNGQEIEAMSFPHGVYSDNIVAQCRSVGYKYLFSSDACLNAIPTSTDVALPIGRIHISERALVNEKGEFQPAELATRLFLQPYSRDGKTDRSHDA